MSSMLDHLGKQDNFSMLDHVCIAIVLKCLSNRTSTIQEQIHSVTIFSHL